MTRGNVTLENVTLTDTHCHLDMEQFDPDRQAVLERAARAKVTHILIPGLDLPTSRAAVKLAGSNPMVYAAVGIHPTEASAWGPETRRDLLELAGWKIGNPGLPDASKVVAIGEIGLDYYWDSAPHDAQRRVLREQLSLAAESGLPVILHMREARDTADERCASDLLDMLEDWAAGLRSEANPLAERPGVLHSFTGGLETARKALQLGFCIGVTGPITFEKNSRRQEIVAVLPLERILIETDAPFQTPHPYRGKRNEPAYVRLIADKIALLHSTSLEQVAVTTSRNARRLFAWKETA